MPKTSKKAWKSERLMIMIGRNFHKTPYDWLRFRIWPRIIWIWNETDNLINYQVYSVKDWLGHCWKTIATTILIRACLFNEYSCIWYVFFAPCLCLCQIGTCYWPLAQTVNFALVPPRFRMAYVGSAAFIWTNILSFIKASKAHSSEPGKVMVNQIRRINVIN